MLHFNCFVLLCVFFFFKEGNMEGVLHYMSVDIHNAKAVLFALNTGTILLQLQRLIRQLTIHTTGGGGGQQH